eukprot:gene33183-42454_t
MDPESREQEQELSDEDECSDKAAKWFILAGYTTLSVPDAGPLNCSMVGWHLLFKWNGVGWCHGWVSKYYPSHRRGYNFEVVYEDVDRRDHIMCVQDYGSGDSVPAGT